ncbi:MAG: hypothetical protein CMJ18_03880 [Phycisphaeraceae bacterium]|nr:hypothetical protein [Phycisphaeraceae bacterium]
MSPAEPNGAEAAAVIPQVTDIASRRAPAGATIARLFEQRAQATPDALAVTGDRDLSYGDLNRLANRVAHLLAREALPRGGRVAICMAPSDRMVIAMLGILKAGGAYVPIDPSYPAERITFMLEDTAAPIVLTERAENGAQTPAGCRFFDIADPDAFQGLSDHDPQNDPARADDDPAYVIYTSGSTGTPKGVVVPHRAVVRLVLDTDYVDLKPNDRIAQASNCCFDAATFEIWGALLNGASLHLFDRDVVLNPVAMAGQLERHRITTLFLTTALFNQMVRERPGAFRGLRHLLFGGEAADPHCVRAALDHDPPERLLHVYGPTENTTFSTWHLVRSVAPDATTVPIGSAIARTTAHVLDDQRQPVAEGETGELWLGGEGLADGYLNQPELTAERFVDDPDGNGAGRCYRTGDIVRLLSGGQIEFVGRRDHQVKLRGFRVELGEIEVALEQHDAVAQAVVTAREDLPGERRLVAYVVRADAEITAGALRDALGTRLPDYMVPQSWVLLDSLPLTTNGKVDRHALPAPDATRPDLDTPYVAPRDDTERTMVAILDELLGIERIGVEDDFYVLGAHSLVAIRFASAVSARLGVDLPLADVFAQPTVASLARLAETGAGTPPRGAESLPTRPAEPPLSFAQERVWFVESLQPNTTAYHFQSLLTFRGPLDVAALQASLAEIVRRHEIYRTTFETRDGRPVQVIHDAMDVELPVIPVPPGATQADLDRLIDEQVRKPFDVMKLPLIRWILLQRGDHEHVLVHIEHHLVHDGWSFNVFLEELSALYAARRDGRPDALAPPSMQFADFACRERDWMSSEEAAAGLEFWRRNLRGPLPETTLPLDRPRPARPAFRGAAPRFELPSELCRTVRAFCRAESATLFMTMYTAFAALLHRYGGQDDLCIGTAVANRRQREAESMIGMTVNNVVLRTDTSGNPTFRTLLGRVRDMTRQVYAHEQVPFDQVVAAVQPRRDLNRNPLFQIMFSFHDSPLHKLSFPDLDVELHEGLSNGSTKFDIGIVVIPRREQRLGTGAESDESITIVWEYDTDLFDASTIDRMIDNYRRLLERMVCDPDQHVWQQPLLSDDDRRTTLTEWNDTAMAVEGSPCVHERFEEQARRTPDRVALTFESSSLTYRQLNERANCLAHHLRACGVGPDTIVGVSLERSTAIVVAVIAVLKAGGAYLSLDPGLPNERLSTMIDDSSTPAIITSEARHEAFEDFQGVLVTVDRGGAPTPPAGAEILSNPEPVATGNDLAYVIYTSGSTGVPKAVLIEHRALTNHMAWMQQALPLHEDDVLAFKYALSFDVATLEIFAPLLVGARLVVAPAVRHLDAVQLVRLMAEERITVVDVMPSMMAMMLDVPGLARCTDLRFVICGAEVLSADLRDRIFEKLDVQLANLYGPSETTIDATWYVCRRDDQGPVPIGRPMANTRLYVLDRGLHPVPIGVVGELYIGGAGVARGYLNRPELTQERFIDNPFTDAGGERLYRTGDLVRYRADGNLDFIGRIDEQVKVRGYRIEPGEIESVLQSHPSVLDAAVVGRGDCAIDDPARLRAALEAMDPEACEHLLAEIESDGVDVHLVRRHPQFELNLDVRDPQFARPPSDAQRNWILQRSLDELSDDLQCLDEQTRRFVAGSDRPAIETKWQESDARYDDEALIIDGQQVMQRWEQPLMEAMARIVTEHGGDVLEVGFGMGISATHIQQFGARSHTIIEYNDQVAGRFDPWRRRYRDRDIRLVEGRWQDVVGDLGPFDGIFFDAYPLDEQEYTQAVVENVTFAAPFFAAAAGLLRPGGIFTYYTNEIDSFSRRHQRLLLSHFRSFTLEVVRGLAPPEDCQYWWADSMAVVKAVKGET